ncbi:ubiquitin-protein ligase E3A-like [Acanthaster planci]|uniref:Ubiquitin-protein ligase E3A n=1 Tax=Acanthaster planci TaxID=133434 RepID=A0A8B7ZDM7_ACAPL|nr:ubiquitin-protein ligase E3A-like [Acanthaster planci]
MNPPKDLSFGAAEEESTRQVSSRSPATSPDDMKRAAVQKRIEQYFYQLIDGCGNKQCSNEHCASNKNTKPLSHNEAAIKAVALCKAKALLCCQANEKNAKQAKTTHAERKDASDDVPTSSQAAGLGAVNQLTDSPSDDASTSNQTPKGQRGTTLESASEEASTTTQSSPVGMDTSLNTSPTSDTASTSYQTPKTSTAPEINGAPIKKGKPEQQAPKQPDHLSEKKMMSLIDSCKEKENFSPLVRLIGEVFSNWKVLNKSFLKPPFKVKTPDQDTIDLGRQLSEKEQERMIDDKEKDEDESVASGSQANRTGELMVDIEAVQRVYAALEKLDEERVTNAMLNAIISLSQFLEVDVRWVPQFETNPRFLNVFVITMENPSLQSPEYLEVAYPSFCKAVSRLPLSAQATLARIWSKFPASNLRKKLESLQQLITCKVLTDHLETPRRRVNDDESITGATKCMRIIFYANILGGKVDKARSSSTQEEEEMDLRELLGAVGNDNKDKKLPKEDPLAKELSISVLDSTEPLIPFEEFYNEPLCDQMDVGEDFARYKKDGLGQSGQFSFLNYPFILTVATKNTGLYYDNRVRMYNERRLTVLNSLVQGEQFNPYLKLKVKRSTVIDDALVNLEIIAMENPSDLKKQLYVEFEGEQGVDEGGVSKEFFQLVVEDIFNPDIGMFTYNEDTKYYWFNPTSFENERQFTLIGIVLGLAIYNNIILDIQFPMVVYRKLLGRQATFDDLKPIQPVLYNSYKSLLEFKGNVEEIFMTNFVISYKDVFGSTVTHNLIENGENTPVTKDNRQEFVNKYVDYILNKLPEKQFKAFKRGFDMVTDESPLKIWFRPEEVELLVCGSRHFDFEALEEATEYDSGYTKESTIIKDFWEIVHRMSADKKKKLLMFTTGSDRVPVGGLAKLRLIIAKNGPDSDRLPTSHTCFNVLLLPEYSSKEKLEERLLKAITHAKGFGML